ncbi:MAG: hypothetical protein M1840_000449 [Geoglossum simile]|nr:MAG: hypothetical protein M1840_000449 [Geoglossum simile]
METSTGLLARRSARTLNPQSVDETDFHASRNPPHAPGLHRSWCGSVGSSSASALLTRENLSFHETTSPLQTPEPLKPSSATSSTITPKAPRHIREALSAYNILVDVVPYKSDPKVSAFVESVIHCPRHPPRLKAVREFIRTADAVRNQPKGNAILAMVGGLFPEPEYMRNGMPFLGRNFNVEFVPRSIPRPSTGNDTASEFAPDTSDAPKNPRPDFAFGVSKRAFDDGERHTNHAFERLTGVSEGIWHSFFVVEWTSQFSGGCQYNAQNQAAGSGAALVYAAQKLQLPQTSVFSATIDSESVYIWVHWCQQYNNRPRYLMSLVSQHFFRDEEAMWSLRRTTDNIFDWGLGRRLVDIRGVLRVLGAGRAEETREKRE